MKKKLLITGIVALFLFVAVIIGVGMNAGRIAKVAIEKFGPQILGVPVTVTTVTLFPWSGKGAIYGLKVGNPPGFSTDPLMEVGKIAVALEVGSLTSNPIRIHTVEIESPIIRWEGTFSSSNLGVLQNNAQNFSPAKAGSKKSERRVSIGKLTVTGGELGANFQGLTAVKLPLPSITMNDVGGSNGATFSQVTALLISRIGAAIGEALQQSRRPIGDAAQRVGEGGKAVLGTVKNLFGK